MRDIGIALLTLTGFRANKINEVDLVSSATAKIRIIRHGASGANVFHLSVADPREGESMSFVIFSRLMLSLINISYLYKNAHIF